MMNLEIISKYPSNGTRPSPLLFIHGALHGAWCWEEHFLDYFAQHSFAAHAVNLRGHGNSAGRENLRWTRISDFVEDIVFTIQQLSAPPILIGHSMGGFVIQKYLENRSAPAAVLLSSAPTAGFLPAAIRIARRRPFIFAKANFTRSLFPLVATPDLAREAFFSAELSDELLLKYWEQMQDDSYRAFLDMAVLDLPGPSKFPLPVLVLGMEHDNMLKPDEIEATARAYNTQAEILPGSAHNSMLEPSWQTVAERILVWLNEREVVG